MALLVFLLFGAALNRDTAFGKSHHGHLGLCGLPVFVLGATGLRRRNFADAAIAHNIAFVVRLDFRL